MGKEKNSKRDPDAKKFDIPVGKVLLVILLLTIGMVGQVFVLHQEYVTHITLIFITIVASLVAMSCGYTWNDIKDAMMDGYQTGMYALVILMTVGVVVSTWIAAGTIPTLIYYGLKVIDPTYFLVTACIVCAVSSVATGSSWTTGATFGIAFIGIGQGLGINPAMTAGAVISGAIFGDKMSPMSDSTNLAAAVAEADLFDHIKSMMYTTIPAISISLVIYLVIGLMNKTGGQIEAASINEVLNGLKNNYFVNPIALIPPVLVIVMAIKKFDGLVVMITASIVGMFMAMIFGGYDLGTVMNQMDYGFVSETGIASVDKLLTRGGLQSMMWTVSLAFVALGFAGILEETGMLNSLLNSVRRFLKSTGQLVLVHGFIAIAVNILSTSQHMAIILSGRMLEPEYKKRNYLPQINSRVCEDMATVTSPLVPWGLCGVYFSGVLGVSTWDYFPYVFLAFLTPVISVIYAFTGKFMFKEGDIESVNTYSGKYTIHVDDKVENE